MSGDCFANRLCVSHVVVLSLDVGLHICRAASIARYDRVPGVLATNDETRLYPQRKFRNAHRKRQRTDLGDHPPQVGQAPKPWKRWSAGHKGRLVRLLKRGGNLKSHQTFFCVPVKCPDNRDAREPNRPDLIRRLTYSFASVLPLSRVLLGLGKLADICSNLAKGGGNYMVRQPDWFCKL